MIKNYTLQSLAIIFLLTWFCSCSTTRTLGPDEHLLVKNNITLDEPRVEVSDLQAFIQQKPNKKVLGMFRLKLWAYQKANKGKETRLNRSFRKAMEELPVILDTQLCLTSARHMKTFLNNSGYFHANVKTDIKYRRKLAQVHYQVTLGRPYVVRDYKLKAEDPSLDNLMKANIEEALVQAGQVYSAYTLDDERDRITTLFKNRGYYYFSKDYLSYLVDSTLGNHQLDITLLAVNPAPNPKDSSQSLKELKHERYQVRDIFIHTDYDPLLNDSIFTDTLTVLSGIHSRSHAPRKYFFIDQPPLTIRPSTITQNLFLNPLDFYNLNDVTQTYSRLNDLQFYRFVNIEFYPAALPSDSAPSAPQLDCNIQLTRNKVQAISLETEGTNSGGDFGVAANIVYENRNLFRGAELLNIKLKGAMEIQKRFGELYEVDRPFFNTFETGIHASLLFPKFLVPVNPEKFSRYFRPKTTINAGINYQERTSFRRYVTEMSFGYDWKESAFKRHILNPIEINSVRIFPDSAFTAYLQSLNDSRLTDQYTDHLIMAMRYSFIYNNQQLNKKENFLYFRTDFEPAGNLMSGLNSLFHSKKDENGQYSLLNIKYAQYLKLNNDFRYYNLLGATTLVFRAALGLGYPYGNSSALPFDKGFYSGGANGMRGWAIRSLGPGSYNDVTNALQYDRMGDILAESNFEYRFPLLSWLNGAFFADAGNIWLLNPSAQFPDGDFKWNLFFRQIALDGGFGFRFDFNFFVFRLDGAIQLRNPALVQEQRWVKPGKLNPSDVMWNFGIGYPF